MLCQNCLLCIGDVEFSSHYCLGTTEQYLPRPPLWYLPVSVFVRSHYHSHDLTLRELVSELNTALEYQTTNKVSLPAVIHRRRRRSRTTSPSKTSTRCQQ
eukprot:scaffold4387_cov32-Cyclotella_meneghiniana.AAC.7